MVQDDVDTYYVPVPIGRDHCRGPHRGVRTRVIAVTYLRRQMERENLLHQLDFSHAHTELNAENIDEEESQDEEQERDPDAP